MPAVSAVVKVKPYSNTGAPLCAPVTLLPRYGNRDEKKTKTKYFSSESDDMTAIIINLSVAVKVVRANILRCHHLFAMHLQHAVHCKWCIISELNECFNTLFVRTIPQVRGFLPLSTNKTGHRMGENVFECGNNLLCTYYPANIFKGNSTVVTPAVVLSIYPTPHCGTRCYVFVHLIATYRGKLNRPVVPVDNLNRIVFSVDLCISVRLSHLLSD